MKAAHTPSAGRINVRLASPQQNNQTKLYYEALVQRIVDVYAGFTPEEMEMVEALGWGLGKPTCGG